MTLSGVIQPFAMIDDINNKTVSFGNHQIVRCEDCRTYINLNCELNINNKTWKCNICGKLDSYPEYY
jgi:predicted RNA-binding Zn-ribbon protein involved in translation (DUF1610 family)